MLTYVAMRGLLVFWAMFGSGFGHAPRPKFNKTRAPQVLTYVAMRILPVVLAMFGPVFAPAPRPHFQKAPCRDAGFARGLGAAPHNAVLPVRELLDLANGGKEGYTISRKS